MGIQYDQQQAPEGAHPSIYDQDTIAQPMTPPSQPPSQPPRRSSRGKRGRWFIAGGIIVLALVLVLGSVFAFQLASRPATQPTPAPTVAATATPAPTRAATPTPAPTKASTPTPVPTKVPTPTPAPPVGIYQPLNTLWMSNASTGWARTTAQRIVRTTDGGKSWQDVTPPYPAGMAGQVPPAFTSSGVNVAWVAISGVVFRTSDGGQSWQQAALPTSTLGVSQLQFVNAQNGWVLASFGGGAAGSEAVNLFRTTDGGQTWSLVASAPGAIPFHGIKSGMSWISATTGWITGTIATPNTVYLYRTQDGGVSWQPQALSSSFPVLGTQPPVFFSASEGLLPVTVSALKGPVVSLYTTHDGGATWGYATMIPVGSAWDFLTMQQGWTVGANGTTLFETSNGGQLWTMMIPSANFRHITQLDFVSAHEGWAISTATPNVPMLLKTMDGGQTWVQVSPIPTPFRVSSVSMVVNPTSIADRSCGTSLMVTYTATFHLAAGSPGGTIRFTYTVNNGRSSTPASLMVAPGQTTASYTFVWSGALPADHTSPGPGGVMVQSPNAISSPLLGPNGMCG